MLLLQARNLICPTSTRCVRALLSATGPAVCAHRSGIRLSLSGLAVLVERTASAPSGSESVVALTTDRDKQGWGATGRLLRRSCCRTKLRGYLSSMHGESSWECDESTVKLYGVAQLSSLPILALPAMPAIRGMAALVPQAFRPGDLKPRLTHGLPLHAAQV